MSNANEVSSVEYKVEGMTCGGCASSVTKAIQKVAPSSQVQVTLESGRVRVLGEHEEGAVRDAVEGAGFDFLGRA